MSAAIKIKQDKEFLVRVLTNHLNWSESHLNSFTEDSLSEIYNWVMEGYTIKKAKTKLSGRYSEIHIPKAIVEELNLTYGDRFCISVNLLKKEVILNHKGKISVKVRKGNNLALPMQLFDKKILKENDETLVMVKGDKIILKSFSNFQ